MTIASHYGPDKFGLSFELFPPKTPVGMTRLFEHLDVLVQHKPDYITCTYGAGGSTQGRTLQVVAGVRQKYRLPVATHLTCVGSTREQLHEYLDEAQRLDIRNVVALRGDPPQGETAFVATDGGFSYANELVAFIRDQFPSMGIAVAGYPETHREAPSAEVDLEKLRRKVDAGADVVITQLFYNNDDFFRFRDRCEQIGIGVPIVPGLLPVTNFAQIQRLVSLCGAKLPEPFVAALQAHDDNPAGQFDVGVEFATRQAQSLVDHGVAGLHFFVLNKSEATSRVLDRIEWKGKGEG